MRLTRRADYHSIRHLEGYLFEVAANVLQDRLRLNCSRQPEIAKRLGVSVSAVEKYIIRSATLPAGGVASTAASTRYVW